jgi:hypothetical protein
MMTTRMHAHTDRIRNPEMIGGTFGPDAAGLDRSAKWRRERNPGRGERVVVRARTQDQVVGERERGPDVPLPSMTRRRPHLHTRTDCPHLRLITGSARTGGTPRNWAVLVRNLSTSVDNGMWPGRRQVAVTADSGVACGPRVLCSGPARRRPAGPAGRLSLMRHRRGRRRGLASVLDREFGPRPVPSAAR